jgi:hypothetical protein
MRYTAIACMLAGCCAFQPVHLLRTQALAQRSNMLSASGSNAGVSDSANSPRVAVDAMDYDKLAASLRGKLFLRFVFV